MKSLKPVVFVQGDRPFYRQNTYAQVILLEAMQNGINDPRELRKLAGLQKVADVYRTLDKMAIRKEYHEALSRVGVSLDSIVTGIKSLSEKSSSDATRLKAYQTLLRSLGLDKYEKQEDTGKGWEEVILGLHKQEEEGVVAIEGEFETYDVNTPITPDEEEQRRIKERALGKQLYEGNK